MREEKLKDNFIDKLTENTTKKKIIKNIVRIMMIQRIKLKISVFVVVLLFIFFSNFSFILNESLYIVDFRCFNVSSIVQSPALSNLTIKDRLVNKNDE